MKNCFVDFEYNAIADLTPEFVPNTWTITRINVPKPSRGKGIGTKLLNEICAEADRNKVTLTLEIMPSGDLDYGALHAWYLRHGFKDSRKYIGILFRRPQ